MKYQRNLSKKPYKRPRIKITLIRNELFNKKNQIDEGVLLAVPDNETLCGY